MSLKDKKPFKKNNLEETILSFMFGVVFSAPVIAVTGAVIMIVSTVMASAAVVTGANLVAGGAVIIGSAGGMTLLALDVVKSLCGELEPKKIQGGVLFGVFAAMGLALGLTFGLTFENDTSLKNDIPTIKSTHHIEKKPLKIAQNISSGFNTPHIEKALSTFEGNYKNPHKGDFDRIDPHARLGL